MNNEKILAESEENDIYYKVVWRYGDNIYITVMNLINKNSIETTYKCVYTPRCGIDVYDMNVVEKKLDELIRRIKSETKKTTP